jgi:hypothetical protein
MKSRFTTLLVVSTLLLATAAAFGQALSNPKFPANANGRVMADEFGRWALQSQTGISSGAQTVTLNGCYVKVGTAYELFYPIATNTPLLITDGTNSETVTPTAVTQPTQVTGPSTISAYNCTFTATFANSHVNPGFSVSAADNGLEAAINYALAKGIGTVTIEQSSFITNTMLSTAQVYPQIQIEDLRSTANNSGNGLLYWNPQPTSALTTSTGAPAVRVGSASGCTGSNTVCDTSIAVASGGFTNAAQYVWVAYVDVMGGVSQASPTAHYTSAGAVQIEFLAPAAATGQVGWIFGIGLSYATAYWFPASSTYCTLTTIETVTPACALANTAYNQSASNAFVSKPLTTFALYPVAGGLANTYNPNIQNHTTFAYVPSQRPSLGFQTEYAAFTGTPALTASQLGVLGTVVLPPGYLNFLPRDIELHGKFNYTPTTGGTAPEVLVEVGDITDFSTGTPKALCTELEVHTTTTAAYSVDFTCTLQTQATGTTGSIQPGGFLIDGLEAGTTLAIVAPEQDTGAITADVQDQDLLYIVFSQTTSAETTGPTLQKLTINQIN